MESQRSHVGLNGFNFFVAATQAGFGPFIAVWLAQRGWRHTDIGLALSIGSGVALFGQLPAGWLVDAVHGKRWITSASLLAISGSALLIAVLPQRVPVWAAEALAALAACVITPSIAAITLRLCGHRAYSLRLGVNARYASLGAAAGAALLGMCAWAWSDRAVFIVTAAMPLPALVALHTIHLHADADPEDHHALLHPRERHRRNGGPMCIFREPALHAFALCALLFHLTNAAALPIALNHLAQRGAVSGPVVAACVILPQLIVAAVSPWAGSKAHMLGRRPVLLVGFAALPARTLLLGWLVWNQGRGDTLVMIQALDGVSAAAFGLSLPLIAADTTRRTGYLNLAIGALGLACGLGATVSTTLAGLLADMVGAAAALFALTGTGAVAWLTVLLTMPETRPHSHRSRRVAPVAALRTASPGLAQRVRRESFRSGTQW